jgi:hypothetical protein
MRDRLHAVTGAVWSLPEDLFHDDLGVFAAPDEGVDQPAQTTPGTSLGNDKDPDRSS